MPPQRQTQSYLRGLFARHGIAPQHRYGQNFLIDLNIHELIVNTAEVGPDDVVLEVGPGAGAMTALMASRGAAVIAVEIDPEMAKLTARAVDGLPNVRVLNVDALASKHLINPEVLDNVRAGLAVSPEKRLKLVSNLPYNIATPIVSNLLIHPELCPALLVVTIQLELAERMRAEPATDAYGGLSIIVQALGDCTLERTLAPTVFWPRPRVESAVVKIVPSAAKRAEIGDLIWFHQVVRSVFLHRRKNLRRVIHGLWRDRMERAEVDALLETIGLTGLVRAEAMNVEEFISLAQALQERLKAVGDVQPAVDVDSGDDSDTDIEEDDAEE